jgi:hypothetical protein
MYMESESLKGIDETEGTAATGKESVDSDGGDGTQWYGDIGARFLSRVVHGANGPL